MKKITLPLLLLALLGSCATNPKRSYTGVLPEISAPKELHLLGDIFTADYSASGQKKAIVEYFRFGENHKTWKRLLALHFNTEGGNSLEQVMAIENYMKGEISDAVRSYQDKNTGGHAVEFIVTGRGGSLELNIFRFVDRIDGPGTIAFQYAEIIPYQQLRTESDKKQYLVCRRLEAVKAMESAPMPHISKTVVANSSRHRSNVAP